MGLLFYTVYGNLEHRKYKNTNMAPEQRTPNRDGASIRRGGEYDHLFVKDAETVDEELARLAAEKLEGPKNPHLEKVFAPVLAPEVRTIDSTGDGSEYDFLMASDEKVYEAGHDALAQRSLSLEPVRAARQNYDRYVTEAAQRESFLRLFDVYRDDPMFAAIMSQAGFDTPSAEAVTALRENEALRYAVGTHLMDRLDTMILKTPQYFGDRVQRNDEKQSAAPESVSLGKMKSREYVALLALMKLSGMFNRSKETNDRGSRRQNGEVLLGQHRQAADRLLGIEETPVQIQ